jgi:hypothetical protein
MANTVDNTLNKVGDVIESIFGKPSPQQPSSNTYNNGGKQTCLEKIGIEARNYHLLRNEWRKDLEYSKPLVDAEYMIQNEFPVGTTDSDVATQAQEAAEKEAKANQTKLDKLKAKRDKIDKQIETLNRKT